METSQLGRPDAPVQDVAQELVAEVDEARIAGVVEVRPLDELVDRAVEVFERAVHDPGEDLGNEAAPDHRPRLGDLAGLRRQLGEPGPDGVLDRLRDDRVADGPAVAPRVVAQGPEQLLDVKRDPIGALVDCLDDLARGRQPGIEDQRGHEGGLVVGQGSEPGLLREALADQAGSPLAEERPRRQVLGPIRGDQQDRPVAEPAGELTEDLEARLVGPLDVLEVEHHGPVDRGRDPIDDVEDIEPPRPEGIRVADAAQREAARRRGSRTPDCASAFGRARR